MVARWTDRSPLKSDQAGRHLEQFLARAKNLNFSHSNMTKPTTHQPRTTQGQSIIEIGPSEDRIFGNRALPQAQRIPPNTMGIIHDGIREKSIRYHVAFWGALLGTPIGGLLTFLAGQETQEIEDAGTYWILIGVGLVVELLFIRIARFVSDNRLRADLYHVYWRIVFRNSGMPVKKSILISPAINILSLVYGFYSLARIAVVATLIGLPFAILFFPGFLVLILAIGAGIYYGIKFCQEMIEDSKWRKLETAVSFSANR